MGRYVIPGVGVDAMSQAIEYVRQQGADSAAQSWDFGAVAGGIEFTDPNRSNSECAALYVGFAFDPAWRPLLPPGVRDHLQHLRDFRDAVRGGTQAAKPSAQRLAELEHVMADQIDLDRLMIDDRIG